MSDIVCEKCWRYTASVEIGGGLRTNSYCVREVDVLINPETNFCEQFKLKSKYKGYGLCEYCVYRDATKEIYYCTNPVLEKIFWRDKNETPYPINCNHYKEYICIPEVRLLRE